MNSAKVKDFVELLNIFKMKGITQLCNDDPQRTSTVSTPVRETSIELMNREACTSKALHCHGRT